MSFSTNEWGVLLLVLLLGWLFGLASRSGGRRWKREYERERAEHAALREAKDARIEAANARIAELERHAPVGVGAAGGIAAAARGKRDDLSLIHGIGREGETRLNDAGIHRYRDISALSAKDEAALEGRMGWEPGHIERQRWREQADMLEAGRHDEHRGRFFN
ncbi:hypothetical protein ABC347_01810 [Sphingomonas sp. 1P06PA]|uniref:hypothetical protein n=1 Tax=Sphingomonas sp. 1P06PA TaxID=554121 RepID=UPI0039A5F6D5